MEGQICEKEKVRRLERLIALQIERQKTIKSNMVPFKAKGIVTGKSRDDKDRYLVRTEHNDYISILPQREHKEGDVVMCLAQELNGNTFRGNEIDE